MIFKVFCVIFGLIYTTNAGVLQNKIDVSKTDVVNFVHNTIENDVVTMRKTNSLSTLHYKYGKRVPGDTLLGVATHFDYYGEQKDVKVEFKSNDELGGNVTYIQVGVSQDGDKGRCDIEDGGIGQNHLTLLVTAYKTVFIDVILKVYGIPS